MKFPTNGRSMDKARSWITISFYCRISILLTVLAIIGTTSPAQAQMRHVRPNAPSNVQLPNYADLVSELEAQKAAEPESEYLTKPQLEKNIRKRRKLMEQAAKELDFILAAKLRDEIKAYQNKLEKLKT
ncbi:MAG: UvrB/UvrC motif-containing protein [Bacteroidetes bacterium]|nr:UvrB/UvrC motif-containing protein [Bacteroidota bacterium]